MESARATILCSSGGIAMWKQAFILWFSAAVMAFFYYAGRQGHSEWGLFLVVPIVLFLLGFALGAIAFINEIDTA